MTQNPSDALNEELDLLVDGQLNDEERRRLLSRLDATPDGWRRCALSFVEAQMWQQDLGGIVPKRQADVADAQPAPPMGRRPARPRRVACRLVRLPFAVATREL